MALVATGVNDYNNNGHNGIKTTVPDKKIRTVEEQPKPNEMTSPSVEKNPEVAMNKQKVQMLAQLLTGQTSTRTAEVREPATAMVATTGYAPTQYTDARYVEASLFSVNSYNNKNATSRGGAPVAKRLETSNKPPQNEAVAYTSSPDSKAWEELSSRDIQNVFGGYC